MKWAKQKRSAFFLTWNAHLHIAAKWILFQLLLRVVCFCRARNLLDSESVSFVLCHFHLSVSISSHCTLHIAPGVTKTKSHRFNIQKSVIQICSDSGIPLCTLCLADKFLNVRNRKKATHTHTHAFSTGSILYANWKQIFKRKNRHPNEFVTQQATIDRHTILKSFFYLVRALAFANLMSFVENEKLKWHFRHGTLCLQLTFRTICYRFVLSTLHDKVCTALHITFRRV